MARETQIRRDVRAGCFTCGDDRPSWSGPNAQGVAARHHDATGHPTWCHVSMTIAYGRRQVDDRQTDIEDVIGVVA